MRATCRNDVVEAVVEICGIAPEFLVDDADLEALQIDSLDLIEIGMIFEERHDARLSSEDFDGVTTFGGAVAVFDRVLRSASAA